MTNSAPAPPRMHETALFKVCVGALVGAAAGLLAASLGPLTLAPPIGWDAAAFVYLGLTWLAVGHLDAEGTAAHAAQEDATRTGSDLLLLSASLASLVALGFVIVRAGDSHGAAKALQIALGILSVVASWLVVHTTYMLRYARIYHAGHAGGVDFNQPKLPRYSDFAYLAFTIGMTFQVSDTPLNSSDMRSNALRHALLSYLYGTVIIATAINLVAGLSR
jgi:uncharacterized membrane protein